MIRLTKEAINFESKLSFNVEISRQFYFRRNKREILATGNGNRPNRKIINTTVYVYTLRGYQLKSYTIVCTGVHSVSM